MLVTAIVKLVITLDLIDIDILSIKIFMIGLNGNCSKIDSC
jgi:hypothetical protein